MIAQVRNRPMSKFGTNTCFLSFTEPELNASEYIRDLLPKWIRVQLAYPHGLRTSFDQFCKHLEGRIELATQDLYKGNAASCHCCCLGEMRLPRNRQRGHGSSPPSFMSANIELSCRPARSHAVTVLSNYTYNSKRHCGGQLQRFVRFSNL